jgi:hypothetical protein
MQILGTIPDIAGLTFTFNHNVQPHPPYIFDRDGNTPPGFEYDLTGQDNWNDPQYIDQLIYVSKRIEEAVDKVLEGSATEPIIIIQGDHGPAPSLPPSGEFDNPSDALVIERTGILNAFYLPEYCRSSLYPTITPVNTFKLVFNECLGGEFVLTEDSTYWRIGEPPIDFSRISP